MAVRMYLGAKIAILLFLACCLCSEASSELRISAYRLLTPKAESKGIEAAFDNRQSTQALIHSEKDEKVITLLSFAVEYEIESVEIISDLPTTLKQTVQVGYAQEIQEPSPSLTLNCEANRTTTLCRPHCGQGKQGVTGTTILWTLERAEETGWTRIYDVIIRGRDFASQAFVENNLALHFGGRKEVTHIVTLATDCTTDSSETGLHHCVLDEMVGYPLSSVTFNAKGLVKFHVYGMPFYFPQIGIGASERQASPESEKRLNLTCLAVSCGANTNVGHSNGQKNARLYMSHPTTSSCSRHGRPVTCTNLELLRLKIPLPGATEGVNADLGTVLVSHGKVLPTISETMTELIVIQSSENELIVSVPRTHHYYGQYKCRCQADDTITSVLESPTTQLTTADFDLGKSVWPHCTMK
ncbi:hypothetical protein FGIG_02370 [Fasciola gigantica]|uniref:Ig-like domain-containing protein n=1 Tax=Fasciola gigantica TaxID=46835 RepID=A0A504Y4W0_FASGI|nr:hypothetical protein FGIG_02370 [Fasciola gigantica]